MGSQNIMSKEIRPADPICPLKKIWCFVGDDNVYANIQKGEAPSLLSFDLSDTSKWRPFLDKQLKADYEASANKN